ncbi:MAG: helix-turn-helix transcriptional regulator [Clostridiaceae bacterium]|nr:helix-turn-helix transcriptional regulator [Clostridiaceae bacterium]
MESSTALAYINEEVFTTKREIQNVYQTARIDAGLTQESAAEQICMSPRSVQKYESGEQTPPPDIVARMADAYAAPWLHNWYCVKQCPLGCGRNLPTQAMELQEAALLLGAVDNPQQLSQDARRLFQISLDRVIDDSEIDDYIAITQRLGQLGYVSHAIEMVLEQHRLKRRYEKTPDRTAMQSGVRR